MFTESGSKKLKNYFKAASMNKSKLKEKQRINNLCLKFHQPLMNQGINNIKIYNIVENYPPETILC